MVGVGVVVISPNQLLNLPSSSYPCLPRSLIRLTVIVLKTLEPREHVRTCESSITNVRNYLKLDHATQTT